jgi:hypothetical protein
MTLSPSAEYAVSTSVSVLEPQQAIAFPKPRPISTLPLGVLKTVVEVLV